MRRGAISLLFVLSFAAGAVAQGPASRAVGYRTFFETYLGDKSPWIVRARFEREGDYVGVQVSECRVKQVLRGPAAERVSVVGAGSALGAARTYDQILFLEPMTSGVLQKLVDVVDLAGPHAEETATLVARAVALSAIEAAGERREAVRRLVFDGLLARGEFGLKLGAREFERALDRLPGLFVADDLPALRGAVPRLPAAERPAFLEALGDLEARRLEGFAGTEKAVPVGRERELYLLAIEALREAPTAAERTTIVDQVARRFGRRSFGFLVACCADPRADVRREGFRLAGLLGAFDAAPAALARAARGDDAERLAAIECLGRLRSEDAVASLTSRLLSDAEEAAAAAVALARIGGAAARAALEAARRRAPSDPKASLLRRRLDEVADPEWAERDAASRLDAARPYLGDDATGPRGG